MVKPMLFICFAGPGAVSARRNLYLSGNLHLLMLITFIIASFVYLVIPMLVLNVIFLMILGMKLRLVLPLFALALVLFVRLFRTLHFLLKRSLPLLRITFSVLFSFQCSTRGPLPITLYAKINHASLYVYHRATKILFNLTKVQLLFSDADHISEYNLISPHVYIRVARLSLFARIAGKLPCVVSILEVSWGFDFGWVSTLRNDPAWFACSGHLPVPADDVPLVFDFRRTQHQSFLVSL